MTTLKDIWSSRLRRKMKHGNGTHWHPQRESGAHRPRARMTDESVAKVKIKKANTHTEWGAAIAVVTAAISTWDAKTRRVNGRSPFTQCGIQKFSSGLKDTKASLTFATLYKPPQRVHSRERSYHLHYDYNYDNDYELSLTLHTVTMAMWDCDSHTHTQPP